MCFLLFPLSSIETKLYTEEWNDSEQHKLNGHFEMSQKERIPNGLVWVPVPLPLSFSAVCKTMVPYLRQIFNSFCFADAIRSHRNPTLVGPQSHGYSQETSLRQRCNNKARSGTKILIAINKASTKLPNAAPPDLIETVDGDSFGCARWVVVFSLIRRAKYRLDFYLVLKLTGPFKTVYVCDSLFHDVCTKNVQHHH